MTTSATLTPPPAATPPDPHARNAEGVFERPEKLVIPRLPAGFAGEFLLGIDANGDVHPGFFLYIRSPRNVNRLEPGKSHIAHMSRDSAMHWLFDAAETFFSPHPTAMAALYKWRASLFPEWAACNPPPAGVRVAAPEPAPSAAPEPSAREDQPAAPAQLAPAAPTEPGQVKFRYAAILVAEIQQNPANARREYDPERDAEILESIKAQGFLLQPVALRDLGPDQSPRYRLIAGHRRYRAHLALKWETIDAKVFSGVDDARAGELALIENLQRENLNPMEEAEGLAELHRVYGYTYELISERTGKALSTVKNAVRLAELCDDLRTMVRRRQLSPTHAKAIASPRWASRPAHAVAIAKWAIETGAAKEQLEQKPLPIAILRALEAARLAVNVTVYREHIPADALRDAKSAILESTEGQVWHLDPAQWKEERAEIDAAARKKAEKDKTKAASRVEAAQAAHVNIKTEDLTRAGLNYASLDGADARFADLIPVEMKATGVDKDGQSLLVCLRPDLLAKLRQRETEHFTQDRAKKLPGLVDRATDCVKRLRRIGPRELAFIVDANLNARGNAAGCPLDGKAFALVGIEPPTESLSRATLATLDPVDLARVVIISALLNTREGDLFNALRWILETPTLGLAEETEAGRRAILDAAALDVFPRVTTDPKTLAEWQKARTMGLPFAEIARSYKTTEADVRGALENK